MFKVSFIVCIAIIIYYVNSYKSYHIMIDDEMNHQPKMIYETKNEFKRIDYIPSDDNQLNLLVTEYYKDLNTYVMPIEKIIPLEVFYDHDGLSLSKSIYECVEYYHIHNPEIMKNTKHMKIIIINSNERSYCIMNTDLII